MAATMGYARVTDVAHRTENLLDLLRRGSQPATDDLLQLLFRARDSLEQAVELSVVGREDEIDAAEILADLDGAAAALAGPGGRPAPAPGPAPAVEAPAVARLTVGGEDRRAPSPGAAPGAAQAPDAKSRHIRVDLRRLDGLMDLIGELVTARGRLNELAAQRRDPAVDDVAIQISRLS